MLRSSDPALSPQAPAPQRSRGGRSKRVLIGAIVLVVALAGAALGAAIAWSGATLESDATALAQVAIGRFGGTLTSARAVSADGTALPLTITGDKLTPSSKVDPGETVQITATVQRPGATGWLLGETHTETLTVVTPLAHVKSHWLTTTGGQEPEVTFDQPVVTASATTPAGQTKHLALSGKQASVPLGSRTATGTLQVSAAARSWEKLGKANTVAWFPKSAQPIVVTSPSNGSTLAPTQPLRLTFSKPISQVLGSKKPTFSPATSGHWAKLDAHTLEYHSTGAGVGLGTKVTVTLPTAAKVASSSGSVGGAATQLNWTVPPGSTLRLQQLLSQAGYLPLTWKASGDPVEKTRAAQLRAAVDAPKGTFTWTYQHTPSELKKLWSEGDVNTITRGATMMFQDEHGLTTDGFAGADVWNALIADTLKGKKRTDGYSYVYVHRDVPQLLTLWHNGKVITTSPGNTGIASAPTELGSFPVFEHLPITTMSGTNPDGSHYNDPGIKWVSYFNGGDALHTFNRASFGTPQSLGCVELPEAAAHKIYPYTPIGTIVTIEH